MSAHDSPSPSDLNALAAKLDRITYLLFGVVVLQATDLLGLGWGGLVLFLVFGLLLGVVYNANG
ncbi:hypothetical protein M0R89_07760 [Halorussus limi]|uniref:Uncharacterized protein n=1 Tax=Halorussus limi TaxID=2938695 RepID=A0A8U0HXR2_9EURY|nr:hypothetical protein [Halorussus limi]UPV75945.1 hypothetical protein M0R89_07760 [Halorussus limi]